MIDGHKVIAWTPYGRERTVSLLVKYMERDVKRGLVDEYRLYLNTDEGQEHDRAYAHELAEQHDWITLQHRPEGIDLGNLPKQRYTGLAYREMVDPDAVYLRLDDDIVYVHEAAIENLVRARLEMPAPAAVFPIIINNAICSYFLQACGKIPREWGEVGMYCMDPVGWANGPFAVKLHEMLLGHIERGTVEDLYLHHDFQLPPGTQFSVSCFASLGSMYAGLEQPGVLVPDEEEAWHTIHHPLATGAPNVVRADAIVSHLSFFTQHAFLNPTNILDRYRELADKAAA
ncbi:hypothetical protein [Streptomyces sp. FL07-04A]|uniref:hypothetical protein n=1 Tax=Streptomyces sp. FL07-04A TaxID=3028658 RepID=UPI0029A66310|nr:hypothetical protein [Streptomyces sp. FL07-04A]MDX3575994.1 hypothetical protein [Streptomyces sp. FL07-04A]